MILTPFSSSEKDFKCSCRNRKKKKRYIQKIHENPNIHIISIISKPCARQVMYIRDLCLKSYPKDRISGGPIVKPLDW